MKNWTRPSARRFNAATVTLTAAPALPDGWSVKEVPCDVGVQQTCYIICHS